MIQGIDIYHGDGKVNFHEVMNHDFKFAFIKATDGTGFTDPMFAKNWVDARAAGLICSPYHFFRPEVSAEAQAQHFMKVVGTMGPGDLPPVLDLEVMENCPKADVIHGALKWLDEVHVGIGKTPMIYISPSFAEGLGSPQSFKTYPLWLARYTSVVPGAPKPWDKWWFWQHSETGTVPGVTGHCDVNYFNGTMDQLKAMCA